MLVLSPDMFNFQLQCLLAEVKAHKKGALQVRKGKYNKHSHTGSDVTLLFIQMLRVIILN